MVPVKEGEKHADSRREEQQTVFGEGVGDEETAPILFTDLILRLLVVAVQRRKIDIRRRLVDVHLLVGRAEDASPRHDISLAHRETREEGDSRVDHQRRKREHHARETRRMFHEL